MNQEKIKIFADRLRELRVSKELTQAQVAARAGLTASAISQFESSEREPSFSSLVKLARALSVSPSYLSGLEEYDMDPEMRAFYREHKNLSKDDQEVLAAIAAQLKKRAKESKEKKSSE